MKYALLNMFLAGVNSKALIQSIATDNVLMAHLNGFAFVLTLTIAIVIYKKEATK